MKFNICIVVLLLALPASAEIEETTRIVNDFIYSTVINETMKPYSSTEDEIPVETPGLDWTCKTKKATNDGKVASGGIVCVRGEETSAVIAKCDALKADNDHQEMQLSNSKTSIVFTADCVTVVSVTRRERIDGW